MQPKTVQYGLKTAENEPKRSKTALMRAKTVQNGLMTAENGLIAG
jgi:hypothetical protein